MANNVYEVLQQRAGTHGHYPEHAEISQSLKLTMIHARNWNILTAPQREALEMIAHKIGRILAGDPNHNDHWDDTAGYATLASQAIATSTVAPTTTHISKHSKKIISNLAAQLDANEYAAAE